MKHILIALIVLLTSCAGPSTEGCNKIPLKDHKIVITNYNVGKYTQVRFNIQIDVGGTPITFVGSNGSTGYYYKKYNFNVGDTLTEDIVLIQDDEHLYIEDINMDKYLQK